MPAAVLQKKICRDIQISFCHPLILFWHAEKKARRAVKIRRCACSQKQHRLILEDCRGKTCEVELKGGKAETQKTSDYTLESLW